MIEVTLKASEGDDSLVRIVSITGLDTEAEENLWSFIAQAIDPYMSELQAMTVAATEVATVLGNLELWVVHLQWADGRVSHLGYSITDSSADVTPSIHRLNRYERPPVI